MGKRIILCLLVLSLAVILATPAFGDLDRRYKVAVLPFDDGSIKDRWWDSSVDVGKGIADELITALLEKKKFRLIEREQIDKILAEQNFGMSGRVDAKSAAAIGKILGVDFLIIGRVTDFAFHSSGTALASGKLGAGLGVKSTTARVVIDARMVNTSTAEIVASVNGKGERKNTNLGLGVKGNIVAFGSDEFRKSNLGLALRDAVNQVADNLAAKAPSGAERGAYQLTGKVFYVTGDRVILGIGKNDGVRVGNLFIVEHVVDEVLDPDTGEVVDVITEPVAEIRVVEVRDKTAICKVVSYYNSNYKIEVKDVARQKMN